MNLEFKIKIDENSFEEGILKILREIRSDWDEKAVNFKVSFVTTFA